MKWCKITFNYCDGNYLHRWNLIVPNVGDLRIEKENDGYWYLAGERYSGLRDNTLRTRDEDTAKVRALAHLKKKLLETIKALDEEVIESVWANG